MKATGIVRRMDDLGRVVIPKEIRRTLRIREGDPLEIFTASEGEVIFKKYSPLGEWQTVAEQVSAVFGRALQGIILVTDRDRVLAAYGTGKKDFLDRPVSKALDACIEARTPYMATADAPPLYPLDAVDREAALALPILSNGDITGAVVMLLRADGELPTVEEKRALQIAAAFLGQQTEA